MQRRVVRPLAVVLSIAASGLYAPAVDGVVLAVGTSAPEAFIGTFASGVFGLLNDQTLPRPTAKLRLRAMMRDRFAVAEIGIRLIRRYRAELSAAQLAAYEAALPEYLINLYADRLYDYTNANLKIVRAVPHGSSGAVDVVTQVSTPGRKPHEVIWSVRKTPADRWMIINVTISGINLTLTQEADFNAYIGRQGFDALVHSMESTSNRVAG